MSRGGRERTDLLRAYQSSTDSCNAAGLDFVAALRVTALELACYLATNYTIADELGPGATLLSAALESRLSARSS